MDTVDLDLYKSVYTIRQCEEGIKRYYFEDEMKTPMHMSAGEEGLVSGVCGALDRLDTVYGTYRSHALFLAKTKDITAFFAEMYSRATGCNKGISGSMHLSLPAKGLMMCSAIVASTIPVAVGSAFAEKYRKSGRVVAVFFGDGATDEGVFWESVNAACLMKLPVLFVCEDNGIAVHTHKQHRQGHDGLEKILENYHINLRMADTTNAREMHDITTELLAAMRENGRPGFLHAKYYRYLEHVGVNEDFQDNYRPRSEYEQWLERDPVDVMRAYLLDKGMDESVIRSEEEEIDNKVEKAILDAQKAPVLPESEVCKGVFSCE